MEETLCTKCKIYESCEELCATAERFVNQDYVAKKANELLYPVSDSFSENVPSLDYVYYTSGISYDDFPYLDKYANSATELDLSFLTVREHICVEYYYYEGMMLTEIASLLSLSKGAVSYYFASAKRKVKRKFEDGEDISPSAQTYSRHNVKRPSYGWRGMLVDNYFIKGMPVEKCREEFVLNNYEFLGNSPHAIGRINRLIRYYKNNATFLDKKIEEIKK